MFNFGYLGVAASLALAAFGSAMGIGVAGQAAIGAWKKSYQQNKAAPFMLVVHFGRGSVADHRGGNFRRYRYGGFGLRSGKGGGVRLRRLCGNR